MKAILRPMGGHVLDIDSSELSNEVLSLAQNVLMRNGFPSRTPGRRSAYNPPLPTTPYHLQSFYLNGKYWWLMYGASNIYAHEGNNEYDVSIAAQSAITDPREWSSTLLNGIPCFTNGKNAPQYWTGVSTDDAIPLPGWPASTTCALMCAFRFHLFAFNITNGSGTFDNLMMWSDAAEPGAVPQTWTPAADNEAGSGFLAQTRGAVIAAAPLGSQLFAYKPTSFYAIEYAGQQPDNIFIIRPVVESIGAMSAAAVQIIGPRQHAVVGNEDVVITDGINTTSIADGKIKRYLSDTIRDTERQNLFTIWDKNSKELWVCVPGSSQFASEVHIWNQTHNAWTIRRLNSAKHGAVGFVTDDGAAPLSERVLIAEGNNTVFAEDDLTATAYESIIRRLDLTFDDAEQIKITSRVLIDGTGTGLSTLLVRLGARNSLDASIGWGGFVTVTLGAGGTPYEISGKYISIEVENLSSGPTNPWQVNRLTIEAEYDGSA